MPLKIKGKLYKTAIRPAILYGTECWAATKKHSTKLHTTEMRMLRWSAGVTRLDKIKNEEYFEYFDDIARRDGENLEKIVVTGKVEGKRPRGRSPIRWSDKIRTARDTKAHIALLVAKSRVKWHKIVPNVVSGRVTTLSNEEHVVERV
ncbi:jg15845 [Pararge aegeria aegeria]|uniref:Jg15845 protein n=1 Tax=Pararge aegeria aegeria TaxID=348720 RepID=A0A8S4SPH8_9NEOP|nr:jg15845 [Pararge aegeria aegeria]